MVQKFVQPDYGNAAQTGSIYPTNIDKAVAVLAEQAAQFAVSAQDVPNMTVAMRAGRLYLADRTIVSVAAQNSAALTAPTANPRRDIVHYDATTGAIGVTTGAEAASPVDPAIPANKIPKARIRWTVGMTSIANSVIDDLSPHAQSIDYLLQRANTFVPLQTMSAGLGIDANRKIIPRGGAAYLSIESMEGVTLTGRTTANFVQNAYHDGSNWQRIDTAANAWLLQFSNSGFAFWFSAPAANPIANWTNAVNWDSSGRQVVGIVPLARMQRTYVEASSASLLAQVNLGTVNAGDVIRLEYYGTFNVSGTGKLITVPMSKSGTAAIVHLGNSDQPRITKTVDTSVPGGWSICGTFLFRVTAAGTLTLGPTEYSTNNVTVSADTARISGLVLNNG